MNTVNNDLRTLVSYLELLLQEIGVISVVLQLQIHSAGSKARVV